MTLNADELKELRAKAEAATPGPWMLVDGANSHAFDLRVTSAKGEYKCVAFSDDEDAAFIAALNPATALSLITAAELNAELVEGLEEARIDLSNTRTNIMVDLNMGNERWEDVPDLMKARIDAIDALIAKAKGQTNDQ